MNRPVDDDFDNLFFVLLAFRTTGSMKILALIASLWVRQKTRPSLFSKALSEGLKDLFIEMGYRFKNKE